MLKKGTVVLAGLAAAGLLLAACKIDDTGGGQAQTGGGQAQTSGGNPAQVSQGNSGTPGAFPFGNRATLEPTAAASLRAVNRLAVGILYLADSGPSISKDQAAKLLPIWQGLQNSRPAFSGGTPSPNSTPEPRPTFDFAAMETAVADTEAVLTPDQMSAINALTQDQMNSTLQKHGIQQQRRQFGSGTPPPGRTPGARFTPSPEQLATFQALRASGQGFQGFGGDRAVFDEVVKVLEGIAGQ